MSTKLYTVSVLDPVQNTVSTGAVFAAQDPAKRTRYSGFVEYYIWFKAHKKSQD
jgi:hypothetical protein